MKRVAKLKPRPEPSWSGEEINGLNALLWLIEMEAMLAEVRSRGWPIERDVFLGGELSNRILWAGFPGVQRFPGGPRP